MNYLDLLGKKLKVIRVTLGLTQMELSEATGVSRPVIINTEKEGKSLPRLTALALYVIIEHELTKMNETARKLAEKDLCYHLELKELTMKEYMEKVNKE